MPNADKIKEELAYLRFWIGILSVTAISLGGWLFLSYDAADKLLLAGALIGIMLLSVNCLGLHRRIEKKIEELGRL